MVILAADPSFAEIPSDLRLQLDQEARSTAFSILQAEAVAAGDLEPDPHPIQKSFAGRSLGVLLQILLGGLCGLVAVLAVQWILRALAIVLS